MDNQTTNNATGNMNVVQAGRIDGPVVIGITPALPADLFADLADLRLLLKRARAGGDVDEATCAAAEQELDAVTESLPPSTDQRRTTALMSLKRLRGLLMDVAELVAKVTAIIVAVRGMS
ncbi:MAG: hypothetical protein HKP61_22265 [Dactylosporangium sp.]|nr:hypothetical protein [Dactylosporangium sp.]